LILPACGGGDGNGGDGSIPSSIVGVWDVSSQQGQEVDEMYTVIRANGTGADYDYMGDSFDQGANYYAVDNYTITTVKTNTYKLSYDDGFEATLSISVKGDTMSYSTDGGSSGTAQRASFQESDFTPEC
jgi:hypothetical protein